MLYLFAILITANVKVTKCMIGAPGVPIPGAEIISQMLAKRLQIEGSLMNYIKNPNFNGTNAVEYADDNLDISVLDMNNFRRLINLSKKRNDANYRRQNYFGVTKKNRLQTAGYKTHLRENPDAFTRNIYLIMSDRHIEKIFHMMKQSIYVARDRIDNIRKIRSYFAQNPSYKIGLLDSAIQHYLRKMDFLCKRITKNYNHEHFLWYLILYEKVLQCNIDINYAVERTFIINRKATQVTSGLPEMPKGMSLDQESYKLLLSKMDPAMLNNTSALEAGTGTAANKPT